jgi:hypothetical protein
MGSIIQLFAGALGILAVFWLMAASIGAFAGVIIKTALWVIAP